MEHSSFVASFIKGTPLQSILARSSEHQSCGAGKSPASEHDGKAGAALSMQTVLSLAAESKGKGAVTLMFCTHNPETLTFDSAAMAGAATQKLPLVCLVESSLDSPLELPNQVASGPYIGADPAFYPRIPVDGGDVVGVFRVTQEAIRRAREGHGHLHGGAPKCRSRSPIQARARAPRATRVRRRAADPSSRHGTNRGTSSTAPSMNPSTPAPAGSVEAPPRRDCLRDA